MFAALRLHRRDRPGELFFRSKNDQDAGRCIRRSGRFPGIHQGYRMTTTDTITVDAEPYPFEFSPAASALLIIDMQRDFLEPGGFGEMLGNDVSQLRRTIEPNQRLLAAWRDAGLMGMQTRAGD